MKSLTADQMEEHLDKFLLPILSSRRTAAGVAKMLSICNRSQQEFVLHWGEAMAKSGSAEMAYQFASHAVHAFELMDEEGVKEWLIDAMNVYDQRGLYPAVAILNDVDHFFQARQLRGVTFETIQRILLNFTTGLSGRRLKIETSETVYTDTETLFLPPLLNRFPSQEDNFRLYKTMLVHLWAQTRFGTWQMNLTQAFSYFPQPEKACQLFHHLERLRLEACIARELPGIFRDINQLLQNSGEVRIPSGWHVFAEQLGSPQATVQASYDLLMKLYDQVLVPPPALCYQGILNPKRVEEVMALRLIRDKELFRKGLVQYAREQGVQKGMGQFTMEKTSEPSSLESTTFQLHLDGLPVVPPDELKSVMDSIIQDIGMIPEEYLVAAGLGGYSFSEETQEKQEVLKEHETPGILYDEWDYHRQDYHKDWCVLRELEIYPQPENFVLKTLQTYRGLIKQLRRTFEVLRGENKLLKAQPHGEDIDLDALVNAYADAQHGLEMTQRVFCKFHKEERHIAVMFMIDMSGSTKGWVNEAEKQALVLLCEALETLGDRYAIYGFSGMTRKRCEIYRIKSFTESYSNLVQQRISGILPQDYTRMGVAIRHLSGLLKNIEARIKLLVTLSDGRPDDFADNYRGTYGIEDTRQALIEAKREGIHPFCITLDTEAKAYLAHMYGAAHYIVLDEVHQLPLKVADIYRKLTS